MNPGLDEIKRSSFQYDFDYEHKIAAEYGLNDSHQGEDSNGQNSSASSQDHSSLLQVCSSHHQGTAALTELSAKAGKSCFRFILRSMQQL